MNNEFSTIEILGWDLQCPSIGWENLLDPYFLAKNIHDPVN